MIDTDGTRKRANYTITADVVSKGTPARHQIEDTRTGNCYDTVDGLAFTIGVAVIEAEMTQSLRDGHFYRIQHPNGVDIYHVIGTGSNQIIVTRVSP